MAEQLGRYQLGPEIGRGNMAVVHRAFDDRLQRQVALKILHPAYARSARHRKEFLTEAHAAGRLSHPGIVTVHDVGESEGKPFMAMELLDGETLQQRLDRQGPLPAPLVIDIAIQLAEALDYAHSRGVVHRDVKADNVVMGGTQERVKLTDFGIARMRQAAGQEAANTEAVVGTPNYMAPEQILGEPVDGRADLYALGVLMYRLLSGHLPFARRNTRATLNAILQGKLPRLRPRDPETPPALVSIVATLMSRAPADRYATGGELAAELRELAAELATHATGRWRVPLSVRWPALMGLVVALVLVVGSLTVYFHQRSTMTGLVFDYGSSMAEVLATEVAEDMLLDDRIAVQAMVADMQQNRQMAHIRLVDRNGQVVASSDVGELDQQADTLFRGDTLQENDSGLRIARYRDGDAERFLFQTPIRYGDRVIGELALGVSARPLGSALRTSLIAMGVLMLVTILTVLLGTFVLSRRLRIPIRVLGSAMDRLATGRRGHRIHMRRRDEFGELFARFNLMAESLEASEKHARQEGSRPVGKKKQANPEGTQPIKRQG